LLARTMQVRQVVVKDQHGNPFIDTPSLKLAAVALPESLVAMLAEHLARVGLNASDGDLRLSCPARRSAAPRQLAVQSMLPALEAAGFGHA
jgi:hypothetical protein